MRLSGEPKDQGLIPGAVKIKDKGSWLGRSFLQLFLSIVVYTWPPKTGRGSDFA